MWVFSATFNKGGDLRMWSGFNHKLKPDDSEWIETCLLPRGVSCTLRVHGKEKFLAMQGEIIKLLTSAMNAILVVKKENPDCHELPVCEKLDQTFAEQLNEILDSAWLFSIRNNVHLNRIP